MKLLDPNSSHQTLIDELLAEQKRLTAVEKFSRRHEQHQIPLQQKHYRDLIPLSAPRLGEQYAFDVDLDACSGCKACVTACHNLNGLDDNETWREVGILFGGTSSQPVQQTVTTACHHCVDPGCLNGCPVEAYEKDFQTGVVRHLDDQCIGCQYCVMKCPYEVPQYSSKRGIVRKCDMCHGRLAVGEAPACVQACPNSAIAINIVKKAEMAQAAKHLQFLPDAPDPILTIPTTRYHSKKPLPANLQAGDHDTLHPQPTHLPLIVMLVLTQSAVGIFSVDFFMRIFKPELMPANVSQINVMAALAIGWIGLAASIAHLGRPLQAWRAFLGWKHSWLSREIIVFGVFGFLAPLSVISVWMPALLTDSYFLGFALSATVVIVGIVGVFCSAMVYHDTKRDYWRWPFSAGKFFGTTLLLGLATVLCLGATAVPTTAMLFAALMIPLSILKLLWELSFFRNLESEEETSLNRSARLLQVRLRSITGLRFISGALGGILVPFIFFTTAPTFVVAAIALVLCGIGELSERYLFFTAVAPKKMPGGL